ncbi:hypothetical protein [Mycobacteroides abscessus]|uniref:hypothetical protein n=1 Tax=Mycobacteroides abscessus TaxID=36809 RepID=UPI00105244BF|nr:hypothetical protein [Mycobacteroides abscessus]
MTQIQIALGVLPVLSGILWLAISRRRKTRQAEATEQPAGRSASLSASAPPATATPADIPATPVATAAPETVGTYGDWLEKFIVLADHAGVIVRTSPRPGLAGAGHGIDGMNQEIRELLDVAGKPVSWPQWPRAATNVQGTLGIFDALEKVLEATTESSSAELDSLETAWNQSTISLMQELTDLKNEYIAHVKVDR